MAFVGISAYVRNFDLGMNSQHGHQRNLNGAAGGIPERRRDAVQIALGRCPDNSRSTILVSNFSAL
jgi:hypothetical protein